jgi:large conductance mechanosensitive channel
MIERFKRYGEEFKTFAMRGNVIDMAVGIIIGAAFGKIVDSLVKDIIMPPLGWILGKVDFSQLFLAFPVNGEFVKYPSLEAAQSAGAVTINYGVFLNTVISFVLVAFAVFLLIKGINKLRADKKEEVAEADTSKECPYCFSKIDNRATRCPHCTAELK